MTVSRHDTVRDLLRRVDEVRGLSEHAESRAALDPNDSGALLQTLAELVEELERSHRRLIESNVQLVSLREVASQMIAPADADEATRTVTRYLCRAFGLPHVFLLLIDRETGRLRGTWTSREGTRDHSIALELPLVGEGGAMGRALWQHRTVVHHASRHHLPAHLPDGHLLQDVFARLGATVSVPLQRSQGVLPLSESHELCGARCALGDPGLLAPPPGPGAETWAIEREERQRHCLGCELMPMMGVIGMARDAEASPLEGSDVTLVESIAMSIAPVVENAQLYQDLKRSERFRQNMLDSMASGLAAVNLRGEIIAFNHAAEALLGYLESEAVGQPFGALFGAEGEAILTGTLDDGREVLRQETVLRARDGSPIPVSLTTSLLRNERRTVYGALATFMDLTPLRRAEEHSRRLDRLAALGRFTSSVAHEIRNPLTGIAAGVQYLSRSLAAEGPQREHLTFILDEIRRLDRIVQDLFEITHPRGLQLRAAPLEQTVDRAVQCLAALIEERGIHLEREVSPRTPPVPHDADQIEQVLINLIKNAVEASPTGGTVRVAVEPRTPEPRSGRGRARALPVPGAIVKVADQGPGVTPEDQKTIFEPFFTTKPGGTGLGLYISHDIVKRHGGSLTVRSEAGSGATFAMELPLEHNGGTP